MSRLALLCAAGATLALSTTAFAQAPSAQLPQRWILAGDSIQAQVFGNAEFNLPGGDARDLTASIIMQDTGVAIQNVSSPGATMTGDFGSSAATRAASLLAAMPTRAGSPTPSAARMAALASSSSEA